MTISAALAVTGFIFVMVGVSALAARSFTGPLLEEDFTNRDRTVKKVLLILANTAITLSVLSFLAAAWAGVEW